MTDRNRPADTRKSALARLWPPAIQHLAPGGIEEQEAEGAAAMQAGACEVIPVRFNAGSEKDLKSFGFVLGPVDKADPLFREATLPRGWSRQGTGHSMWTYLLDEHGRERVSMFYKAAFYDRDAFVSVAGLASYARKVATGEAELILDSSWATRKAMLAALTELRGKAIEQAEFWEGHGDQEYGKPRAAEYRAEAVQYDVLTQVVADHG